jgi:hypothetical protein
MPASIKRHIAGLVAALAFSVCLPAAVQIAAEPESQPTDVSAVQSLARELKSPEFARREAATRKLKEIGASVVDAVTEVGLGKNPEAGIRAVAILKDLYFSESPTAVNDSEDALRKLRDNGSPAVAVEAQTALRSHYFSVRQPRAVEAIRKLNGQIKFERSADVLLHGNVIQPPDGWARQAAVGPDWVGGDESFRHFARLDSLQTLYVLDGHPISDQALAEFKRELPSAEIVTRGAAFLGVGPAPDSLGCGISSVLPDSSAAAFGVKIGDIVVEIEGDPIETPDDLVEAIARHKVGDQVRIVVLRFVDDEDPLFREYYRYGRYYKFMLTQMLYEPESFSPMAALGILSRVRREIPVTLMKWQINN